MKKAHRQYCMLMIAIMAVLFIFAHRAPAQAVDPFPTVSADPAVPLLYLPGKYRAQRENTSIAVDSGQPVDILNVEGPGCVRHIWFTFGLQYNLEDVEIEITVDGAAEPQVRMPFRSFFGVLLGFEDYYINSAGLAIFPNFTVTNDPLIPEAPPGWNFYLPIPFSDGCRITVYCDTYRQGAAMVDWQQYYQDVELTPLRFYAQRNIALPATVGVPFPIAQTEGTGLLAGCIMGWRQKDHSDFVFHNSGTRMLIDDQTDPQSICGWNLEDDFNFAWGFNQYQTRWAGCPYYDNRSNYDQDGVFYRFFGPDPIQFRTSLFFYSNTRSDDYEAVSYFYKAAILQVFGPADQFVFPDESAVFTVTAHDPQGGTLSYQWYKYVDGVNDTQIGTNSDTLTIGPPVVSANEGDYYCVVTNDSLQSVVSDMASLVIMSETATITFTQQGFDQETDLSTAGTLVAAVNLGTITDATLNGITFDGDNNGSYTAGGVTISFFGDTYMSSQNGDNYAGTTVTGIDATNLLDTVGYAWNATAGDGSVDFSGLTVGQRYSIQLLIVDDIPASMGRTIDIWSGSSTGTPDIENADYTSRTDQSALLVTGTFTADVTVKSLYLDFLEADPLNAGWINAMQLRTIP